MEEALRGPSRAYGLIAATAMNLVFVNHAHPSTPHVAGMRLWYFAMALAARGHRIVQVCGWRTGEDHSLSVDEFSARAAEHDWRMPLVLAMKSRADPLLRAIRSPATPTLVRKALVAANYTTRGGVYSDFTAAVRRYLPFFANGFRPDVVWGTFGNTDSWLIAQAIARSARCPWVADMKDPWDVFIPTALRCTLALRFTDMRAATCNSEMNADQLDRWFSVKPTVIYSGVDPSFFRPQQHMKADPHFRLTLTGSVHDEAVLERFVDALQQWLLESGAVASRGERTVEIVYAGADRMKVEPILGRLSRSAEVRTFGYLPLQELAGLCASAHANSYIWNPRTFHHKLLELLCCGRPVIAFPGETDESLCLARVSHGALFTCANSSELSDALTAIASTEPSQPRTLDPANLFSWDAQALKLEAFFRNLIPE